MSQDKQKKLELLSPAGDLETVRSAILYGASAIYVGGSGFGLRSNSGLDSETLAKAVSLAHSHSVKIYLTCNVVATNDDIDNFPNFIKECEGVGVDAVIVSDLGIFDLVKTHTNLPIHISTQAGVMNYANANMLYRLGAKRIILARETSLEQIKRIRDETNDELELEAFVHGAMCMGFSGRCLISSYLTNRDANGGRCAQPCRWKYSLMEETREGEHFPIGEDERGTYILNSKDLCMIEHIDKLYKSGICSLKIEGRAKTAFYCATITNAYRKAIDAFSDNEPLPSWVKGEVNNVSHRPYCTGFYLPESELQSYESSNYIRDCDFVGVVEDYHDNKLEIIQRNFFTLDDTLEIISPDYPPIKLCIKEMTNSEGTVVTVANHAVERLNITLKDTLGGINIKAGSFIRRVKTRKNL